MLINKDYILQRIGSLIEERLRQDPAKDSALLRVYDRIPLWLRKFLRRKYRYIDAMRAAHKEILRKNKRNLISYHHPMTQIAADFVQYCLTRDDLHFDTVDYFPVEQEPVIDKLIDGRIKTVLCQLGWSHLSRPMNSDEVAFAGLTRKLQKSVRRVGGYYKFSHENKDYYLPHNTFEFGLWIYHYGLKSLPDAVKSYIAGKDFLDVGAFYGDSALVLLNYNPRRIFAYEPVSEQFECLVQTIERNGVSDKVVAIKKGLGDKEAMLAVAGTGSAAHLVDNNDFNEGGGYGGNSSY